MRIRLLPSRLPLAPSGRGLPRGRGWGRVRKENLYKVASPTRRGLLPSRLRVPPPSRREASPLRHALRATSPEARGMRFAPPRPSGGFLLSSLAHRRAGACSRRSIRNRIYIIQLDCSTIKHTVPHDSCHIVLQRQGGGSKPPPYNLELYPAPSGRGLPRGRGWGRVR